MTGSNFTKCLRAFREGSYRGTSLLHISRRRTRSTGRVHGSQHVPNVWHSFLHPVYSDGMRRVFDLRTTRQLCLKTLERAKNGHPSRLGKDVLQTRTFQRFLRSRIAPPSTQWYQAHRRDAITSRFGSVGNELQIIFSSFGRHFISARTSFTIVGPALERNFHTASERVSSHLDLFL